MTKVFCKIDVANAEHNQDESEQVRRFRKSLENVTKIMLKNTAKKTAATFCKVQYHNGRKYHNGHDYHNSHNYYWYSACFVCGCRGCC